MVIDLAQQIDLDDPAELGDRQRPNLVLGDSRDRERGDLPLCEPQGGFGDIFARRSRCAVRSSRSGR